MTQNAVVYEVEFEYDFLESDPELVEEGEVADTCAAETYTDSRLFTITDSQGLVNDAQKIEAALAAEGNENVVLVKIERTGISTVL